MSWGRALLLAAVLLFVSLGSEAQAQTYRYGRRARNKAFSEFVDKHPCIAWPIIITILGASIVSKLTNGSMSFESRRRTGTSTYRSDTSTYRARREPIFVAPPTRTLSGWDQLAGLDSTSTSEQTRAFLTRLLQRFQEAQGAGASPEALKAYASARVLDQLHAAGADHRARKRRIVDVSVVRVEPSEARAKPDGTLSFVLDSELTYGVKGANDARPRHYSVRQQWRLDRQPTARAPGPAVVRDLGCPACARVAEVKTDFRCSACNADVTPGLLTWRISGVGIHERKPIGGDAKLELRPET